MRSPKPSPSRQAPAARRVLIVENCPLLRRGLTALIDNEHDLTVCAEAAATLRETLDAIASARPDLVIVDLSIMMGDVLAMVKDIRLRHERLPVLLLGLDDAPLYAARAFEAGASGCVSKQGMTETLLIAIRCVLGGKRYVSPKMGTGTP